MQRKETSRDLVELAVGSGLWAHVPAIAPLVVIGTKEGDGYDLAPKHMATPLSWVHSAWKR